MGHNKLITALSSTPIQRKIYSEDFEMILGHLPFLRNRLESDDSSKSIQKILNRVSAFTAHYT